LWQICIQSMQARIKQGHVPEEGGGKRGGSKAWGNRGKRGQGVLH